MYRNADANRLLTIEEFERLSEEDGYLLELVRGHVVREPRPNLEHGRIVVNVSAILHRFASDRKLGSVHVESGFALPRHGATVRGPDVSFVSVETLAAAPPFRSFPALAPDLAVEVVSPSDSASAIDEKVGEYLDAGCRLVWILDPRTRTVVIHRQGQDPRRLEVRDELSGEDVLPGFTVRVQELFA